MNQAAELERMEAVRVATLATTKTIGWTYIKQMADNVVKKAIQDSLDETDRDKGEMKRLKASALQKGFNDLFNGIEQVKSFDKSQFEDQSGFGELEGGFEPQKD